MRISAGGLRQLLNLNVVEIKFLRRHEKPGWKPFRRMLCTNDQRLLNSLLGKRVLHFQPSHFHHLPYNPAAHNLVISWDILLQNYRAINCNDCDVVSVINTSPDSTKWWEYFAEHILRMAPAQKQVFMNTQ